MIEHDGGCRSIGWASILLSGVFALRLVLLDVLNVRGLLPVNLVVSWGERCTW